MSTTIESLELEINSNSTKAINGIDALSSSLSKLKNAVKGGVGLTSVANQVRNLDAALQSVDGSSADKIDKLATSLSKLSSLGKIKISASIGNQIRNIGSAASSLKISDYENINGLTKALNGLNTLDKASGLRSAITQLNKLPELAKTLSGMGVDGLCNDLSKLSNALAPLAGQANSVSNAFSKLPASVNKLSTATRSASGSNNGMANSAMNLYAKFKMAYNAVHAGAQTIGSWITKSNEYIEDLNLFTASMGEYAGEAQQYAEQVGELMGIDPGQFMRYEGVFNTIIEGFGVAGDRAYTMSKNLTQLGYDLSSFYNISFEDSMQKLQSGISGELEPLRRLGYDLSQARLQQEALNLGIEKSVSDMTQAEKSQLRYYAIMTQVTTAQGDMARTLNAPANQVRILQAQVIQCARALGNIFIPALNAVLPYAIALAKALRLVADQIAKFFGFTLPKVDYSGLGKSIATAGSSVGDLADNASKAGKGIGTVAKKAKELKNNLLGIDELHIISPNDTSDYGAGSSGAGGGVGDVGGIGGSDLGFDLPEYDFLGKLVDSKADEILKKIKDTFTEITAIASGFLLAIGTILVVTGTNIPLGVSLMAAGAASLVSVIAMNWNSMSDRLAKVLTIVTAVLGGFLLAIGAFLAFSGVNVPLGAALMVAGAASFATSAVINWKFLEGNIKNVLSILTGIVGGALLAMGALFAFTGVDAPLGIALMAAGVVSIATSVGLNWNAMSAPIRRVIGILEAIVGGALLAQGAILAFSGVNVPLGIALIAAGALSIASSIALNWNGLTGTIRQRVALLVSIVSGALLGIGAVLSFSGVNTPLGIALMTAGSIGLVSVASLNWNALPNKLKKTITTIVAIVSSGLIAVGAILTFTGVAAPMGIAMMIAGGIGVGTSIALNWNSMTSKLKKTFTTIVSVVSTALMVIGAILLFTPLIGVGLGMIVAGMAGTVTAISLNWNTLSQKVKKGLALVKTVFDKFVKAVTDKFEEIVDWFKKLPEKIKNAIKEVWDSLVGIGGYIVEGIVDGMESIGKGLKDWADGVVDSVCGFFDIGSLSKVFADIGGYMGDGLMNGLRDETGNLDTWMQTNILDPINRTIEDNPISEIVVGIKDTSDTWWSNVQKWWVDQTRKASLTAEAAIGLVKDGWKTVKKWIGKIPSLEQAISLVKDGWKTVKKWIGSIPVIDQAIKLVKSGWNTVKNWVGKIPILNQAIQLVKSGWRTVKSWIGSIPSLNQMINLVKNGWSSVSGWVKTSLGGAVSKAIGLVRDGWYTVSNWVANRSGGGVRAWVSLARDGWYSVSSWVSNFIGGGIRVGVGLVRSGWNTVTSWVRNLFEDGGWISGSHVRQFAKGGIPQYANGTAPTHGSLFVAGENGAETVGHIGNRTEVMNRFQMADVMYSAIVQGFTPIMSTVLRQMVTDTNGIINAIAVNGGAIAQANQASIDTYDSSKSLSDIVYTESTNTSVRSDADLKNVLKDFYQTYVMPTMNSIAQDSKRQADKSEQTVISINGREIANVVKQQQLADGYSFTI